MSQRLSVIIPALNEALTLPLLLRALNGQTRPPDEIIVADANSTDGTARLAQALGARVVPGGRPGPARNAGARVASGDVLLFLDADVVPGPEFLDLMLAEFELRGCGLASTALAALDGTATDRLLMEVTNLYLQMIQYVSPHSPGCCIMVKRSLHEALGGFDEAAQMAEDHDYGQRAAALAEFAVFTSPRLPMSMRRVADDGLFQLAFKYVWCEMHALAGKPIYSLPFEYAMGGRLPPAEAARARRVVDVAQLREQLGRFENPLQRMSASGLAQLERLAQLDWLASARDARGRLQLQLETRDSDVLHRYLLRRLALMRRRARNTLRQAQGGLFSRLQSRQPVAESIQFIERTWSAGRRGLAEAADAWRDRE
jgi:glycosyltransferase involved in cell wall biosynthesis